MVEVIAGVEGQLVHLLPAALAVDVVVGLDGALVVAEELEADLVLVWGALQGGEVQVVVEPRGVPVGRADFSLQGAAGEEPVARPPPRAAAIV